MSDCVNFGQRLRVAMAINDVSGRDLASEMKISPQMVCEMTKGKKWPSAKNLALLCRTLGVSMDWMMTDAPVILEAI